jgi:succinate dehydrogenase hydrophobic anchor subunit
MTDTNRRVVMQGSDKDAFRVDYDKLMENLSPGECKFKIFFFSFLIYAFLTIICLSFFTVNQFDFFLSRATTVPCKNSKKKFWNCFVSSLLAWCSVHAWDGLIGYSTISKEIQMNHLDRNYNKYLFLLAPLPPRHLH